jgi:hypothetical protein
VQHRELAKAVAGHKSIFFAESTPAGISIDYMAAVSGGLHLAPKGEALQILSDDYRRMVQDGLLLEEAKTFEELLQRCSALADKVNAATRGGA